MNVSLNTINHNSFRSIGTKKQKSDKAERLRTPEDFAVNKTKLAVGCCFAIALAIDILYFTIKRNIKYDKIAKEEMLLQKKIASAKNCPSADIRF